MGSVDGHPAEHAAQAVVTGLVNQGAQGVVEHAGHLAPGHAVLGAKAPVRPAADNAGQQGGAGVGRAPGAEVPAVSKLRHLASAGLQPHGVGNQQQGLLPGHGHVGRGLCGGGAGHNPFIISNADILVEPGAAGHIGKGDGPGALEAVGPVKHGHQLGPGNSPVLGHIAAACAGHDAPLLHLVHIALGPGGRGLGCKAGFHGQDAGQDDGAQQQGDNALSVVFQSIHCSPFLMCLEIVISDSEASRRKKPPFAGGNIRLQLTSLSDPNQSNLC